MVKEKILNFINFLKKFKKLQFYITKIQKVVEKIMSIIQGWYYKLTNKNTELANRRISICNACEHRITIDVVGDICARCGCVISAKARVEDEHCELNKW